MKWPKANDEPWTHDELDNAVRFFAGFFLVFTILAVGYGIKGYYTPIPTFANYLKELPPGITSKFNPATYQFYFQGSYLVQVFMGIPLIPALIFTILRPEKTMGFIDKIFRKLGLDD